MSKIKTPEEETLFKALWKKALELGFQCNETDAHELAIVAREQFKLEMEKKTLELYKKLLKSGDDKQEELIRNVIVMLKK